MPRNNEQQKPEEKTLASCKVKSEATGKTIFFDLKENHRGVFLRVSEVGKNGRNTIFIPADALNEACEAMDEMWREATPDREGK